MLVLILPASAFLVRLFIIQRDCGHGSYFKARWTNNLLGRVIGTNAALAAIIAAAAMVLGWRPLVIGYLPISMLAGSIGIWLFYV